MTEQLNTALQAISDRLYMESLNYAPYFLFVKYKGMAGKSPQVLLNLTFGGGVEIGSIKPSNCAEVFEAINSALHYHGDYSSHPNLDYLASNSFKQDAGDVMSLVGTLINDADFFASFRLDKGHPFYPVFWDFAFWVEKNEDTFILIGSSSD